jgi:HEAT repeat protein
LGHGYWLRALSRGNLLVFADNENNTLREVARGGKKVVWVYKGEVGCPAVRLRNGNTLVGHALKINAMAEIEPDGKKVWETYFSLGYSDMELVYPLVRPGFDLPHPARFKMDTLRNRMRMLKSKNPLERIFSACYLVELFPKAPGLVPALTRALGDKEKQVREEAQGLLAKMGRKTIPFLVRALKEKDPLVREGAVCVLGKLGVKAGDTFRLLISALGDKDRRVRSAALWALPSLGKPPQVIIPALVKGLKDEDSDIRISAARWLESMGPKAKAAIPCLLKVVGGKELELRYWATLALGKIGRGNKEVRIALVKALREKTYFRIRFAAACALGDLGGEAELAVPALRQALWAIDVKDRNLALNIRSAVLQSLGQIGSGAKEAVPDIKKILNNEKEDPRLRIAAAEALGNLGPIAKGALQALRTIGRTPTVSYQLRKAALAAQKRVEGARNGKQ